MFSWGLCGLIAGLLGKLSKNFNVISFGILCGISGFIFGWIMNIWHWVGFVYPLTYKTFLATYIASFPFDTLHAVGNVLFAILFGKSFYMILMRFKRRMYIPKSTD
jgi:energy-coupling factor transport system substrate-specific component